MSTEDGHKRTREILWLLASVQPSMPLSQALGYLKAVEAELILREVRAREAEKNTIPRYRGTAGAANLARDFAGLPMVNRLAKAGHTTAVARVLQDETGCAVGSAMEAAESLVNMLYHAPFE